jgi:tetratricopeptide (TPR) repeat protein
MPFDPYSAALEVIPLAGEGLQKFLDHNEVRKLYKLIKADVRQADLPAGVGAALAEKIEQLRVDPMVAGALKLLLETGESRAKAPLRQRLAQLLVLPDSPMSADELAAVVLRSVEANLHRAKRDDRSAGHLDEQITRDALRDLPHQVAEAVSDGLGPSRGVPMRFVRMLVELAPDQSRVLEQLGEVDQAGLASVQQALAAGGIQRLRSVVDAPQPWLLEGSAELWAAVGRLLESIGEFASARAAYERSANHPGVVDRARQLVRAANAAEAQGEGRAAAELIARVHSEDAANPAVLLHDARSSSDPDKCLEILDQIKPKDDDQAALAQLIRTGALIGKLDFAQAREALDAVRRMAIAKGGVDELAAMIVLAEAQASAGEVRDAEADALREAGNTFTRLAEQAKEQNRWSAAGVLMGRGAICYALASDSAAATPLIDEALHDERLRSSDDARRLLGYGAFLLTRFDAALTLLPAGSDDEDRLARAAVHVIGPASDATAAVDDLRDIFGSKSEARQTAGRAWRSSSCRGRRGSCNFVMSQLQTSFGRSASNSGRAYGGWVS